ncbi:MAG: UbiD family decarboxylase domain-containing protein, partial [Nitrospinota bacterium]
MGAESLRAWLEYLESQGRLLRVRREVSPVYELAAVTQAAEGKGAILFEKVAGYGMPVASNVCAERELFARALGLKKGALIETYRRAIESPRACELIDDAPFRAVGFDGPIDLLSFLPLPIYHEGDAGPYLTAALLIARDPETGYRNVSINRLQALGGERLGVLILPGHLRQCFESAARRGMDLDVAIVIGAPPAVLLASQAIVPFEVDELEIASALSPEGPLALSPCETVPLEVPRDA